MTRHKRYLFNETVSKNRPQVLILRNFDERKSGKSIVVVVVNVVNVVVVVVVVAVESLANQSKNFFPPKKETR